MMVRTEWLKLRTTRLPWVALASVPAVSALVAFAVCSTAGRDDQPALGTTGSSSFVDLLAAPASVVTVVALVLGVLQVTSEWRHQTVTTTFLASPVRWRVVGAKAAAAAVVGLVAGVLSLVATAAVAVPWLRGESVPVAVDGDVVRVASGLVLSCAVFAVVGVGVGAVVRNQTLAVSALFVWLLAVEGLVQNVWGADVFRWLPAAAGAALVRVTPGASHLEWWPALAVFAAYAAVVWTAGVAAVTRRDAG